MKSLQSGAGQRRALLCLVLVSVIAVSAIILATKHVGPFWTVIAQVSSAVAGAWLGGIIVVDRARETVQAQARPALRQLWDHANRVRGIVIWVDERRLILEERLPEERSLSESRAVDWLSTLGDKLRDELEATASSANDWQDLAPEAFAEEVDKFGKRIEQLPSGMGRSEETE